MSEDIVNKDKLAQILNKIPIFSNIKIENVHELIDLMKYVIYPENKLVIEQGAEGDSMYIIKSGSVRVTRLDDENEDEIQLAVLADGDYFGEMSLIDNMPRSANIITLEESIIFRLTRKDFNNYMDNRPDVAVSFYRTFLEETTYRFRNIISKYTFTSHDLKTTSSALDEINKDLNFAKKIQNYMLNRNFLDNAEFQNVKMSYVYDPCIAIGGDLLNVIMLDDDNLGILLADVTGHGITAALVTGVVKSGFTLVSRENGKNPGKLFKELSEHLHQVVTRLFATSYYGVLNLKTLKMVLSNAGHHHPLIYKTGSSEIIEVKCKGPGLGMIPGADFNEVEITLEKGDKILFFSDGFIEQINENQEMYGKDKFKELYYKLSKNGDENILDSMMNELKDYSGDVPIQDDITLVLFEF